MDTTTNADLQNTYVINNNKKSWLTYVTLLNSTTTKADLQNRYVIVTESTISVSNIQYISCSTLECAVTIPR
jgi:hypothetical protein